MANDLSAGQFTVPTRIGNTISTFHDTNNAYFVETGGGKTTLSCFPIVLAYLCQLWSKFFCPTPGDHLDTLLGKVGQGVSSTYDGLGYLSLTVQDIDYKGGMSYGGREYANYGWISFGTDDSYFFPVQWVNFKKAIIVAPQAGPLRFQWYFAPGLEVDIRVYDQPGVPDIRAGHNASPEWSFNPYKNIWYGP